MTIKVLSAIKSGKKDRRNGNELRLFNVPVAKNGTNRSEKYNIRRHCLFSCLEIVRKNETSANRSPWVCRRVVMQVCNTINVCSTCHRCVLVSLSFESTNPFSCS